MIYKIKIIWMFTSFVFSEMFYAYFVIGPFIFPTDLTTKDSDYTGLSIFFPASHVPSPLSLLY